MARNRIRYWWIRISNGSSVPEKSTSSLGLVERDAFGRENEKGYINDIQIQTNEEESAEKISNGFSVPEKSTSSLGPVEKEAFRAEKAKGYINGIQIQTKEEDLPEKISNGSSISEKGTSMYLVGREAFEKETEKEYISGIQIQPKEEYSPVKISNGFSLRDKSTSMYLVEREAFEREKKKGDISDIQIQPKEDDLPEKASEDKSEKAVPPVGFSTLFRFSSCCDRFLIVAATLVALVSGASVPAIMIIFGKIIDELVAFDIVMNNQRVNVTVNETINETTNDTAAKDAFLSATANLCMWNVVFGCAFFFCNYIMVSFFSVAAANQAFFIRCRFMQAALKQDIAWYDTHQTGDFATRITGDLARLQDGIGEKVGICISFVSSTLLCVGCGIYYGWKLALVILCITPVSTAAMAIMTKIQATFSSQEMEAYGTAGIVAEEVLSSIRTVAAFGGQQKEIERYEACLIPASSKGIKRGLMTSIGSGITWFCIFAGYALAFWYGVKLIVAGTGEYTAGTLVIVFFNVISASMFIGQTAPYFEAFSIARGAAAKIYSIIEREPSIDSTSDAGYKPTTLQGHIKLKNVFFNYPSRPTVPILRGLSMEANPGETVALVGSSGCGKSTIVQLLLRFYDVDSGSVELDCIDVRDLNLGWLRDHIGLVGQEPVLFSTTIEENIRMGRNDATQEEIEQAAKTANAHSFIKSLPMGYQTLVGERGTQLSGGQKQRIAIARALVRNPRILLLDEATSALDTKSEAVVQAALDEARRGRTTLIVAHRLSTIRNANKIMVLSKGVVKEVGTHEELMQAKNIYYNLVVAQTEEEVEEEEVDEEDEEADGLPELEQGISRLNLASNDQLVHTHYHPTINRQVSAISAISSQLSTSSEKKEEMSEEDATATLSHSRLLKMSAPEWPYALVGGISAIIMGFHFPVFGIISGSILGLLSKSTEIIEEENSFYCLIFLLMAITSGVFSFLQIFMFTIAGEKLTLRLRKLVFANIITQDISFFDNPSNSVGSLCSRLNSDASSVQGATGSRISTALQALSCMAISIFIGLNFNWKIGLVVLSFVPLVLLGSFLEAKVVSGHMHCERKGMEAASKIATEAIESIRTVASLHQEQTFYKQYYSALLEPHRKSRIKSHVRGIAYGFTQGVSTFAYAAALYYGSILVSEKELQFADLLKILEGVLIGAMMVGETVAFTPDYEKARLAAIKIFQLLDIKPTIDACSDQGIVKTLNEDSVHFSHIYFRYPSRPQLRVLRGLDAAVQPGKTVALVGSSGCGKSTCVQLLERFYDPDKGKVTVNSEDIRNLNVSNHRSHLALVSQEPVLFGRSIAENIAYGDNSRKPEMAEIIAAARQANIHSFVTSLPQGYDTPVGDRGTQLSGGQKQRIAIARALVRNPKILLLDEATSALDTESEKVVQEALDLARSGRTCLVIAHRLTTIQNADVILVMHRGKIVERGTHQELINRKGTYYALHNTQG